MNLGIAGDFVERVAIDFAITLTTDNGAELRIETQFTWCSKDGTPEGIDPAEPVELTALVPSVLHKKITVATASDDTGALTIEFLDGSRINVPPNSMYEAWSLTRRDGMRVVAAPDGELSIWRENT